MPRASTRESGFAAQAEPANRAAFSARLSPGPSAATLSAGSSRELKLELGLELNSNSNSNLEANSNSNLKANSSSNSSARRQVGPSTWVAGSAQIVLASAHRAGCLPACLPARPSACLPASRASGRPASEPATGAARQTRCQIYSSEMENPQRSLWNRQRCPSNFNRSTLADSNLNLNFNLKLNKNGEESRASCCCCCFYCCCCCCCCWRCCCCYRCCCYESYLIACQQTAES